MNYQKIYNQIIERALCRALSKKEANLILGYSEAHHILPKCLGGTNEKTNIAHLSAREHFIAHILLTKIYPNSGHLILACHRLLHDKQGDRLNGKKYEILKKKINCYQKTQNKYTNQKILEVSKKYTGQTKETSPRVAKMAQTLSGRNKKNNQSILEMSKKLSGRSKETHEYIANHSRIMTGRTKQTHPSVARMAEKLTKISKEHTKLLVEKRLSGVPGIEIYNWLVNELDYNVHYSIVSKIFNREKHLYC